MSLTGLRDLVYFAPFVELLCSDRRRLILVVIPQYSDLSEHSSTYICQGLLILNLRQVTDTDILYLS